jgi:hypothetical protein
VRIAELRGDVVILACAISAGIHGALLPEHVEEGTGAGVGFALATVLLVALAVGLTRRPESKRLLAGATVVFAGLLVSYGLAVTTGLPVLHPDREAVDLLALGTKTVEVVGLLAAAGLLRAPHAVARPIPLALATMVAVFSGFTAVAVSGEHHSHSHASTGGPHAHRAA